jgi:hypothetical protein
MCDLQGAATEFDAESSCLVDNAFDQCRYAARDRWRESDSQVNRLWDDAEQDQVPRIPFEPARAIEEIGDADLMGRQPRRDGRRHLIAVQTNDAADWLVSLYRIDEDDRVGVLEVREERQAERATVKHTDAIGGLVAIQQMRHGHGADAIVAEQHVAQAQHE